MLSTVLKPLPNVLRAGRDTPVKGGIPASANQQGYLEIEPNEYGKLTNCANGW
jgi:hypothetical protein